MRPAYHRAAWSFSCAFYARRPQRGPGGLVTELTCQQQRLQRDHPELVRSFAVTEYKGDWKFHRECFQLTRTWKCGRICHRCPAARIPKWPGRHFFKNLACGDSAAISRRFGPLFTSFGTQWPRLSNTQSILQCMPQQPVPLVLIPGFHIDCVPRV